MLGLMCGLMCGKPRQDKIKNDNIREKVGVAPIVEKMVETRILWFGHVERRAVDSVVRRVYQVEEVEVVLEKLRKYLERSRD